jgi:hypothetical protein
MQGIESQGEVAMPQLTAAIRVCQIDRLQLLEQQRQIPHLDVLPQDPGALRPTQ